MPVQKVNTALKGFCSCHCRICSPSDWRKWYDGVMALPRATAESARSLEMVGLMGMMATRRAIVASN